MHAVAEPAAPAAVRPAAPWPALAACGVALAALFAQTAVTLVGLWDRDPNYSHGYFVPVLSGFLAYRVLRREGVPGTGRPGLGMVSLLVGVALHLAAEVVHWPPLDYLGLVLVLRGLLVAVGGPGWAARFAFPLLFLFFMFPLPVTYTGYAALWLQDIVSRITEGVLGQFLVVYRQGHTLYIAGMEKGLVVAEECSGLRQIVAFLAFAALYGYLVGRSLVVRTVLFMAALPIAVLANVLRVLLMNLGALWFGTNWLSTGLHHFPVLFSLPVGLVLFLLLDRGLAGRAAKAPPADGETPPGRPPLAVPAGLGRVLWVLAAVLAVGAAADFALARHLDAAGEATFPKPTGTLVRVPLQFQTETPAGPVEWQGRSATDEELTELRKKLGFTVGDVLSRGYRSSTGAAVGVYAVYSPTGEDREHHPEICVRDVRGVPEDLDARAEVRLDAAGKRAVQRFRFITGAGRADVVYYWYYTLPPEPSAARTAVQRLHQLKLRAPSVTVQVTVADAGPAAQAAVEQSLLPALDAAIQANVLPPTAAIGHTRLPIGLQK
jgi:exosortase